MGPKKIIKTDKAPAGLKGIYNQAVVANGMVFCKCDFAIEVLFSKLITLTLFNGIYTD